jgi:hypothetical protein
MAQLKAIKKQHILALLNDGLLNDGFIKYLLLDLF